MSKRRDPSPEFDLFIPALDLELIAQQIPAHEAAPPPM